MGPAEYGWAAGAVRIVHPFSTDISYRGTGPHPSELTCHRELEENESAPAGLIRIHPVILFILCAAHNDV
jgi:hypothetical protein